MEKLLKTLLWAFIGMLTNVLSYGQSGGILVKNLPQAKMYPNGTTIKVTDGATSTDCTMGGGTNTVQCTVYNGYWLNLGSSGTGTVTPSPTPATPTYSGTNSDNAFELTLTHATGRTSYTTAITYQNHPLCGMPLALTTPATLAAMNGITARWYGSAGGKWTIVFYTGAPPITNVLIDVTCIVGQ